MMIYGKAPQAGQAHQLGTAARRALDDLLSSIYEPVTREWLNRQLPDIWEGSGLHLACGNGHDSFILASLIDAQTTLMCIDEDAATVQAARHSGALGNREGLQFLQADPFNWETTQVFDFIYTRIWAGSWAGQSDLMQAIRRNLKTGGILLVEIVTLSGFRAYPYNHAFARTMELISLLETSRPGRVTPQEQILVLLQRAGFETPEPSAGPPAFIPHADNRVVSLALEACREAILHCRGSTAEELNALLLELREFERQDDTLISRPGLLQFTTNLNNR